MVELLTASEVRSLLLSKVAGSQKELANRIGISASYLSDVLSQRREPGPKIAEYLDLEVVHLYRAKPTPDSGKAGGGDHG